MAESRMGMGVDHRQLGADLYNHTWTLLEKENRTRADDDELLSAAHASAYHWSRAGAGPEHAARSQWQISRVNAVLGRSAAAVYHAERCLEHCTENGVGDWDLASAYEALPRAHRVETSPSTAATCNSDEQHSFRSRTKRIASRSPSSSTSWPPSCRR